VSKLLAKAEGAEINVTNSPDYIDDDADWSPDGEKIVFTRHLVSDNQMNSITAEICVLDLGTPDAEPDCLLGQTTKFPNFEEERAPAWSPDGRKIAYMCRRGDPPNPQNPQQAKTFEICVMNADGTDDLQLTNNTVFDGSPKWSPEGEKILFHRLVGMAQQQLFVMNADGSDQTKLTDFDGTTLLATWGVVRTKCDRDNEDDKDKKDHKNKKDHKERHRRATFGHRR
jgi:Tol biopolymer transport system component